MTIMTRRRGSLEERFWRYVEKADGCWIWTGALKDGYGRIRSGGRGSRVLRAHRLSYELHVGPIHPGLHLDHLCRNRACVNHDHLEPVTQRENTFRSPIAVTAKKSRQTHCGRGHSLSGANLYTWNGRRYCRECKRCNRTFVDLARHMASKHPDYAEELR